MSNDKYWARDNARFGADGEPEREPMSTPDSNEYTAYFKERNRQFNICNKILDRMESEDIESQPKQIKSLQSSLAKAVEALRKISKEAINPNDPQYKDWAHDYSTGLDFNMWIATRCLEELGEK